MVLVLHIVQILIALFFLRSAVLLWMDPSTLYRSNLLDRVTFGWLEGRSELRVIARMGSIAAFIGFAAAVGLMVETW